MNHFLSTRLIFGLVAQKNHLIEMVLLSTHNICFGWEIIKMIFNITYLIYRVQWLSL